MTPEEALSKLEEGALRRHVIHYGVLGPSHGDPGGQSYIKEACASYKYRWCEILSQDESLCNCPAKKHNEIVREAVEVLRKAVSP